MCDTYLGLQSANKKGQNVGLVFSKSLEGSKSKHPLSKRLQLTDTLHYPIFWESWPRWHIWTIYQSAKRDGSVSPGEWVSSLGTEHSHEGSWRLRGILQTHVSSVVVLASVSGSFRKSLQSNWEQEKAKRAPVPLNWFMRKLGMHNNGFH